MHVAFVPDEVCIFMREPARIHFWNEPVSMTRVMSAEHFAQILKDLPA